MKYLIYMLLISYFNSYGQDDLMVDINIDSIQLLHTKEEIGHKTFKSISKAYRWKFDYYDFVDPGQDFNTTDISSTPNCRLILGVRSDKYLVILYECGSYWGPLTNCILVVSNKKTIDVYIVNEKIETEGDLFERLKQKRLNVERLKE